MTCDYNGTFWPKHRSIKEWVDHLTRDRTYEGYTIIFHNGQGYDFQLIVEEMQSRKNLTIPKMEMNGEIYRIKGREEGAFEERL